MPSSCPPALLSDWRMQEAFSPPQAQAAVITSSVSEIFFPEAF
jgi:hypothetical protein